MLIFYLYQVEIAIRRFCRDFSEPLPSRDDFEKVVFYNRHNLLPDSWTKFYTETFMSHPLTAAFFRLPNALDLPAVRPAGGFCLCDPYLPAATPAPAPTQARAARFAFAVVQTYLSSPVPNGRLAEESFPVFEQATMRLRGDERRRAAVAPYSETQLYFWIAHMHTLLDPLPATPVPFHCAPDGAALVPRCALSFDALLRGGLLSLSAWTEHYSPARWSGVGARMMAVPPDRKPLTEIRARRLTRGDFPDVIDQGPVPEMPSDEELELKKCHFLLLIRQKPPAEWECEPRDHAELLFWLFRRMSGHQRLRDTAGCVHDVISGLKEETQSYGIYVMLMRNALVRELDSPTVSPDHRIDMLASFERLLSNNKHLLQDDLTDSEAKRLDEEIGGKDEPAQSTADNSSSRLSYATLEEVDDTSSEKQSMLGDENGKQSILGDEKEWDVVTIASVVDD